MRHIMIWIKIIDYQLENSEKQLKQSPDNCRVIIIHIASDYGKQNNMKNVRNSLRQTLNKIFSLSTALLSWGPPAKQKPFLPSKNNIQFSAD